MLGLIGYKRLALGHGGGARFGVVFRVLRFAPYLYTTKYKLSHQVETYLNLKLKI